ncbi:MAG: N-acetylmuramoyl-L-alanine amidase [Cyanobacteria bacterium P01_G01_bin.19]
MASRKELGRELNLEIDFIPESNSNRPQTKINPQYITIHNTDNTARGADCLAHARYVKSQAARDRQVSWHYTVDDLLCVKHLPLNEMGWHAANRKGNRDSIGIEICMHQGIDRTAADKRAALLTAILMYDLNIPLERVVTHHYWSGKNCPRLLLDDGKPSQKWQQFLNKVETIYRSIDEKDSMLEKIFTDDNELYAEWSKTHGEVAESPAYCSMPVVAERKFSPEINANRERLIVMLGKKWVNETVLHYHFFDRAEDGRTVGTNQWRPWATGQAEKNVVRKAFKIWQEVGIGLEFREVNSRDEAEIRIGFERGDGAWSYLGRDVLNIARDDRTMNFGWDLTRRTQEIDTAIHEIGHTLGFPHEHQNPNAGIVWNEEAVYAALAGHPNYWSRETTYHNIIRKITPDLVQGSNWDANSVMHYPFEAGLIEQPEEYREGISPTPGLSARDKEWVQKFYPPINHRYPKLRPFESVKLAISAGEQRNFIIEPEASRYYNLQTFGTSDSVLVLFEEIDGEPRYLSADDDSGEDYNAHIRIKLFSNKRYILRVRLYYSDRADETTVMMW